MSQNNDQNVVGIRLVIDRDTQEFWLFKDDNTPGLIHGKLGATSFDYNPSNSQHEGLFTGQLEVINIPFEITRFDPLRVTAILATLPSGPDMPINEQKIESKPMSEKKFEYFDPETQSNMTKPPADLSRKHKKKWFNERKVWLGEIEGIQGRLAETQKDKPALPTVTPKIENLPVPSIEENDKNVKAKQPEEDDNSKASGLKVVEIQKDLEEVKASLQNIKEYLGAGNKLGKIKDVPGGYFIGRYFPAKAQYAILQVPDPVAEIFGQSLYLVFEKKSAAEYMMKALLDNISNNVIVEGTSVYAIDLLKASELEEGAAIITNAASFLQLL